MLPVANVIVVCLFVIGIGAPYISSWIAPVAHPNIHLSSSPCGIQCCHSSFWEIKGLQFHFVLVTSHNLCILSILKIISASMVSLHTSNHKLGFL
jgi:hypothetical protein